MTSPLTKVVVPLNDPKFQQMGHDLAVKLIEKYGIHKAVAITTMALIQELTAILHLETPMPEMNIAFVRQLLADLKTNVLTHVQCCLDRNRIEKNPSVH